MKAGITPLLALAILATSCGGGNPSTSLAGNWRFFVNSDGFVGSSVATGALAQSGTTVTGTLTFTSGCIATAQLTGTVSQNSVNFKLSEPDQLASFTGTLTAKFLSASGSWTAPQGGCPEGTSGTWLATKRR